MRISLPLFTLGESMAKVKTMDAISVQGFITLDWYQLANWKVKVNSKYFRTFQARVLRVDAQNTTCENCHDFSEIFLLKYLERTYKLFITKLILISNMIQCTKLTLYCAFWRLWKLCCNALSKNISFSFGSVFKLISLRSRLDIFPNPLLLINWQSLFRSQTSDRLF